MWPDSGHHLSMLTRSPCEYYIKYLALRPERYTTVQMKVMLERQKLDALHVQYIERVRASLQPPDPFYPLDPAHTRSQRFLITEQVQALFRREAAARNALTILETPRAREFAEAAILAGAPHLAIARVLKNSFKTPATEAGVELFRHFFWNIDLLDSSDVRILLNLRIDLAEDHPDPEVAQQYKAMKKAYWKDPRVVAADLPSSPLAAMAAQMRMGIMPAGVQLQKVLDTLRLASSLKAVEVTMAGGRGSAQEATLFMTAAKIANEMLENMAKPEDELKQQIQTLRLRAKEGAIPHVHQLTKGNHTVDLMVNAETEAE
jgi:hypothetical protein